ncbi:MAG: rhodanese-like domain-containing protein [bacterium]|nr:rhodanese-like domain-containing protein [bacterium]
MTNRGHKSFDDFLAEIRDQVVEVLPWEVEHALEGRAEGTLVVDVREESEFSKAHVMGSMLVPRGILESAADHGYEDTVAELADGREKELIVICRSGRRSLMAAHVLQLMGFKNVKSLKGGVRGMFDSGYALHNIWGREVPEEELDIFFYPLRKNSPVPDDMN